MINLLADLVLFSTTQNSDASSANNSALDAKSSDKSFIYIRKRIGPSIEPCGNPASIAAREEYIAYLKQPFAAIDIRSLLQYLIIYLICHFL